MVKKVDTTIIGGLLLSALIYLLRVVTFYMKGTITIDRERCKGCALCIEFCPKNAVYLSDDLNLKGYFVAAFDDGRGCTGCGSCAVICPDVAIEVMKN